jgi:RNA polymerase sigma-70 factor, ECF subfamily
MHERAGPPGQREDIEDAPALAKEKRQRFAARLQQNADMLQRVARRKYHPDDAEDLVQDTIRCALEREQVLINLDETRTMKWLTTTMRNRFIDLCRRRDTEKRGQKGLEHLLAEECFSEEVSIDAWRQLPHQRYAKELRRLSKRDRSIWNLKVEGYKNTDIAEMLDMNYHTVGTVLHRTRDYLRRKLVKKAQKASPNGKKS